MTLMHAFVVSCFSLALAQGSDAEEPKIVVAEIPPSAVPSTWMPDEELSAQVEALVSSMVVRHQPVLPLGVAYDGEPFRPSERSAESAAFVDDDLIMTTSFPQHVLRGFTWPGGDEVVRFVLPEEAGTKPEERSSLRTVTFSPDGKSVMADHGGAPFVRRWRLSDGALTAEYGSETHPAFDRVVSHDGSVILLEAPRVKVRAVRTSDGELLSAFGLGFQTVDEARRSAPSVRDPLNTDGLPPARALVATALALSPDGSVAAIGYGDRTLRLFDTDTGKRLAVHAVGRTPRSVAFSPDGRYVVAGTDPLYSFDRDEDGHLGIDIVDPVSLVLAYDVESGEEALRFASHKNATDSLVFSPDGALIATASGGDPYARVWSFPDGDEVGSVLAEAAGVAMVAFSPSGGELLTSAEDALLRVHDLSALDPGEARAMCGATICD